MGGHWPGFPLEGLEIRYFQGGSPKPRKSPEALQGSRRPREAPGGPRAPEGPLEIRIFQRREPEKDAKPTTKPSIQSPASPQKPSKAPGGPGRPPEAPGGPRAREGPLEIGKFQRGARKRRETHYQTQHPKPRPEALQGSRRPREAPALKSP